MTTVFLHFQTDEGEKYSLAESNISHILWGDTSDPDDIIPTEIYCHSIIFGNFRSININAEHPINRKSLERLMRSSYEDWESMIPCEGGDEDE